MGDLLPLGEPFKGAVTVSRLVYPRWGMYLVTAGLRIVPAPFRPAWIRTMFVRGDGDGTGGQDHYWPKPLSELRVSAHWPTVGRAGQSISLRVRSPKRVRLEMVQFKVVLLSNTYSDWVLDIQKERNL